MNKLSKFLDAPWFKKVLGTFLFLVGCVHAPKQEAVQGAGQWSAKARITDKAKGTLQTAGLEMQSVWPEKLRMDVFGPFGINLAALTVQKNKMQTLLYQEKRFLSGSASSARALMKVDFDPTLFIDFAFDRPPRQNNWKCEFDQQKRPSKCVRSQDDLVITWTDRDNLKRMVSVENSKYLVQILFQSGQTMVEIAPGVFELAAPAGYQVEQI